MTIIRWFNLQTNEHDLQVNPEHFSKEIWTHNSPNRNNICMSEWKWNGVYKTPHIALSVSHVTKQKYMAKRNICVENLKIAWSCCVTYNSFTWKIHISINWVSSNEKSSCNLKVEISQNKLTAVESWRHKHFCLQIVVGNPLPEETVFRRMYSIPIRSWK